MHNQLIQMAKKYWSRIFNATENVSSVILSKIYDYGYFQVSRIEMSLGTRSLTHHFHSITIFSLLSH